MSRSPRHAPDSTHSSNARRDDLGDMAKEDTLQERDWRYFSEALAWYPGQGLTGAQVFGVVQQVKSALRDGRITPHDLGIGGYTPPTIRLQDVTDKALLIELHRRLVYAGSTAEHGQPGKAGEKVNK